MMISYELDENDFLTYQLFLASKSEQIRKKRQKNRIVVPLVYLSIGFFFVFYDNLSFAVIFAILGLLWYLFYPLWEKRRYEKLYQGFIRENFKNRIGNTGSLEFINDYILAKDNGNESKVLLTAVEKIYELSTIILISLKDGQSYIIPKDKISNLDTLRTNLKEIATNLKINYIMEDNWEWK